MPHENIRSIDGQHNRAQVIWRPAANTAHAYDDPEPGYVQVMTEDPDSPARFPEQRVSADGKTGETLWGPDHGEPCTGFAITLDRDGCNRLIRAIRRARDSAFGADA